MAMHKDGHVGYYVRNGEGVEWRDFSDGCVKTKVAGRGWEAGSWTTKPEIPVAEELPALKTIVTVFEGGKVNVRGGNGLTYGRITQHETGTTCLYVATAENEWHAVVVGKRSVGCPGPAAAFSDPKQKALSQNCVGASWVEIAFLKQGRIEELGNADAQSLAHFVNDAQLHRIVGTVDDVADGGLGHAAFDEQLILRHLLFLQQLRQPLTDRLIELHFITIPAAVPLL